ncbi:glycine zipper family protein [Roseovarius aestuarii]|uniref:Glycine zipper family protein n=1 Tax=Roseovarius aestuarii TaxID=475083 RepID=A0A1X7BNM3_9RHOB|nr:glycine zipper family protein [Roseovarius aestuarii]SMC11213.1 hypothetical protein ROA7745_01024 [Roseovarius aestuarii]
MKRMVTGCLVLIMLSACSNSYNDPLLVDGTRNAGFDYDIVQCRNLAEGHTKDALKRPAITGAILGGAINAIGSGDDWAEDALIGVAAGGGVGALEGLDERDKTRRSILLRCMQGRGHRVIG